MLQCWRQEVLLHGRTLLDISKHTPRIVGTHTFIAFIAGKHWWVHGFRLNVRIKRKFWSYVTNILRERFQNSILTGKWLFLHYHVFLKMKFILLWSRNIFLHNLYISEAGKDLMTFLMCTGIRGIILNIHKSSINKFS